MVCRTNCFSVQLYRLLCVIAVDFSCENDAFTPLYVAAQNAHDMVLEQLIKAGATVDKANNNGGTPL